jgi:hypothetical protein
MVVNCIWIYYAWVLVGRLLLTPVSCSLFHIHLIVCYMREDNNEELPCI